MIKIRRRRHFALKKKFNIDNKIKIVKKNGKFKFCIRRAQCTRRCKVHHIRVGSRRICKKGIKGRKCRFARRMKLMKIHKLRKHYHNKLKGIKIVRGFRHKRFRCFVKKQKKM